MRIGQLSQTYCVPQTSLYYYIKLGLLIPAYKEGYYDFDAQCEEDLQSILRYKELRLSLREIAKILAYQRLSHSRKTHYEQAIDTVMSNHYYALKEEISQIQQAMHKIELERGALIKNPFLPETVKSGVPVNMLTLLACPDCGGQLEMENISMTRDVIYAGLLYCNCGYTARIRSGVLLSNCHMAESESITMHYEHLPGSVHYMNSVHSMYTWMFQALQESSLKNPVIWEPQINHAFFLGRFLSRLNPEARYIISGPNPYTLYAYKEWIEASRPQLNILYIAHGAGRLPLKAQGVDILLDSFFWNTDLLQSGQDIFTENESLLQPKGEIIGVNLLTAPSHQMPLPWQGIWPEKGLNTCTHAKFSQTLESRNWVLQDKKELNAIFLDDDFYTKENGESAINGFALYAYWAKRQK